MTATLSGVELEELDAWVERALAAGAEDELPILGYGEISLVLGWPTGAPRFACKRMPPFRSHRRFADYARTLDEYVAALDRSGVEVEETTMGGVERADGTVAGYVIQPLLPSDQLAPAILRRTDPSTGHPMVEAIAAAAAAAVSDRVGLDAQLANWVWADGRLIYIDVSTPMLWDEAGACRLDIEPLSLAYPAILRPVLRRSLAPRILDGYRDLRGVYLDLAGNLLKERLEAWLPAFLASLSERVSPPLTAAEVERYYRSDARLWSALLRLRRLDRRWRRSFGRPYPFLLPGRIER